MSLNINQGTARTLVNNTGISTSLAKAIVNYRKHKQDQPIKDINELWNIKGMTLPDFWAITSAFNIPDSNVPIDSLSPRGMKALKKDPRRQRSPECTPTKIDDMQNELRDFKSSGSKNKRRNRKKKKKQEQRRQMSLSPRKTDPLDGNHGGNSPRKNSLPRNRGKSMGGLDTSKKAGKLVVPNLWLNADTASPQSTLLRLTDGNKPDAQKFLTPVSVEQSADGTGLLVMYKEANRNAPISYNISKKDGNGLSMVLHQPEVFPRTPRSTSPLLCMNTNSLERGRRHHSYDSSKSRSRRSTSPSPEKRSKSSPAKTDVSKVQLTQEWNSTTPCGQGSSTVRAQYTDKKKLSDKSFDHVQSWLKTVHDSNLIDKSSTERTNFEKKAQKNLDLAMAGTSGIGSGLHNRGTSQQRINGKTGMKGSRNRSPSRSPKRSPNRSPNRNSSRSPKREHTSRKQGNELMETWKESRKKPSDRKRSHARDDKSRSRHKSKHRWQNKVSPAKPSAEEEGRQAEARLERHRERTMEITDEMRRAHKNALERRQARHHHRSRARSRERRRRRFFNCSIM